MLLIICLTILIRPTTNGNCAEPDVKEQISISLILDRIINVNVGATSVGIAVNIGAGAKTFIAVNSPPKIITFDSDLKLISSQEQFDDVLSINDFAILGGFTLILSDLFSPSFSRTDSRLRLLSPILIENGIQRFQPVSLTTSNDGDIYFANASDNEIWKVDRNGNSSRHSKLNGEIWLTGCRIEYVQSRNFIAILTEENLYFINSYGNIVRHMTHKHSVVNPSDIVVNGSEVWIGGESVVCFDVDKSSIVFSLSSEYLIELGISNISALAVNGDSIFYMLSEHGDMLAKAIIVRETTGK